EVFLRTALGAELLANAAALRQSLGDRYSRYAESDNPEIVTHVRAAGAADYVFVVNDRREAGTYVGQHGLVLDAGLPSKGTIALSRKNVHVYDLTARREVTATTSDGATRWPIVLGPCDGNVFLVTDRPIAEVLIESPSAVSLGQSLACQVAVTDVSQAPINAVIPVRVDVTDPHGRPAEFSGYYGAADGKLSLKLDIAINDTPGVWTIRVHELASGRSATRYVRVRPATPDAG
ncbi:MAG TPA: hypothetical protein PLV92_29990, partial [Pirellulaceae bacterium]|nr:hypothetical protein [Pirellulaceae bacterium]